MAASVVLSLASFSEAQFGANEKPTSLAEVQTGWTPRSDFLLRPNTRTEYRNFGWERYRERGIGFDWLPTYDQLGEPWLSGAATVFSWVEDRTRAPDFSSEFSKPGTLDGRHNRLVVARERFGKSAIRLSLGEAMRTTFTSLTLDMSRFTGLRADAVFGTNHEVTLLGTRPSDPIWRFRIRPDGIEVRDQGSILAGGHWEGRFLDGALAFGATAINHHRFDSLQRTGTFLKGTMPLDMNPDTLMVRVEDDSPFANATGASVYGSRMDITLRRAAGENRVIRDVRPVVTASGVQWEDDHWSVKDGGYVEYTTPVPDGAVGVQTNTRVAQDYRVGLRQVHRAVDRFKTEEQIRVTPLEIRARAGGTGSDQVRDIGVGAGLSSAMNLTGFNGMLALGRMNLEWEYARSTQHYQFPEEQLGARSAYSGAAGFVRGTQDYRSFTFGGEYFSISPAYNSYALDDGNFRGGDPQLNRNDDFVTRDFSGNHFPMYFNETQGNPFRSGNRKRNLVFSLVEDNDDDDQFKDQQQEDAPVVQRTQPLESGVYPGWDLDGDGVPDYNQNRNNIPDYREPFFKYWQDEQVFYWGDDFNHNGVVDYFEDDSLPDYPYYKDERGTHLFLNINDPLPGLSLRLGRHNVDQIAGPGQNDSHYLALSLRGVAPGKARLQWEHEVKSVRDDIPNNTFQYRVLEDGQDVEATYQSVFVTDKLTMRKSLVNRGYVGTNWTPVRGLNLVNNFRYELNRQSEAEFDDGTFQDSESLNTWALVNKIDYTWSWKRFSFQPMFKHTLLKQDAGSGTAPGGIASRRDITEFIPILRLDLNLTQRTSINLGVEGFPFLKERLIDRENELRDFKSQTLMGQLKRKGVSGGFTVFIVTGIQYTRTQFDEPGIADGSFVRSFFQIFVGEQILAASE